MNIEKAKESLELLGAEKLARGELIRNDTKVEPYLNAIKTTLTQVEENEKALEIIVNKAVYVDMLKSYINCDKLNGKDFDYRRYKTYNYAIFSKQKLTQAEFDLVKKVVEKYGKR